jgi:hypothetical protein
VTKGNARLTPSVAMGGCYAISLAALTLALKPPEAIYSTNADTQRSFS